MRSASSVNAEGPNPSVGSFIGALASVDLRPPRGGSYDLRHRKRWAYAAVSAGDLYLGVAITDAGDAGNGFAFAARPSGPGRGMLIDRSFLTLPRVGARVGDRPEEGCDAWFRAPGAYLRLHRPLGSTAFELTVDASGLSVHASLETSGAPLAFGTVSRLKGGDLGVTQKRALLLVRGEVRLHGESHRLEGGLGGLDYSHGFLPRKTEWRWAYLLGKTSDGRLLGLNLVEGFHGEGECAVWLGDEVFPLGEGRFRFNAARPLDPWTVKSADGAVDLRFTPSCMHVERRNLLLIRSSFIQPVGAFSGTVRVPGRGTVELEACPGVVEDQRVVW